MSLSKTSFQEAVDRSLKTFAEKIPEEENDYISEGTRLCENVRQTLEEDLGSFLIDSCCYFARNVTVGTEPPFQVVNPDFAIILTFFNDPMTPLYNMEPQILDVLRKQKSALEIAKINETSDIMLITFKNGMCTHLLIENTTDVKEIDGFLQKIKHRGDSRHFQDVYVGFQHLVLMKTQTEFTVLLVRLVNYWLKLKDMNYGSGVKVIFELLSCAVVMKAGEDSQEESMSSAFIELAKMIENLGKLQLEFEFASENDITEKECSVVERGRDPYIMEPCSRVPNNLLGEMNIRREQIEVLMRTGKEMRESLEKFIEKGVDIVLVGTDELEIDFRNVFTQ